MRMPARRAALCVGTAAAALLLCLETPRAQTALPEVEVAKPKPAPRRAVRRPVAPPQTVTAPAPAAPATPETNAARVQAENNVFDQKRATILAPVGANTYEMLSRDTIEALPQGTNAPLNTLMLQAPGVSQDSAVNGLLHVRNEHANVQYRINGIVLPDSVAGLGQVLESSFVGSMALITGALPAQFGLRTAGVLDIETRRNAFDNTGRISVYGGQRETITPSIEYGGTVGDTQFFGIGRYFASNLGIDNPTPATNAIHDYTNQGRFFGYASKILDPTSRLTFITGTSVARFQIPNVPGQTPSFQISGINSFDSAGLNERQWERSYYNVLAWQKSVDNLDLQVAYFSRYNSVHFVPDTIGDVIFQGVASDVYRNGLVNGIQTDAAYRLNDAHTIRAGFITSGERTNVINASTVLPGMWDPDLGAPVQLGPSVPNFDVPINVYDAVSKTGWLFGVYVQDEWKITDKLTLNAGLRFDQMWQFVDANQLSPRVSLTYKPFESTTLHAGYARYFTPPVQAIATPASFALFNNTTNTSDPAVPGSGPVLPERSHVFDVGVTQAFGPYQIGLDAYYKQARDLLDDGQFGAARVLTAFNYERAYNWGLELSNQYVQPNLKAYLNIAWATQRGKNIVSNQQLFTQEDLDFIANNYIYTDHAQWLTASAGLAYLWNGTWFSAKMIAGSGLRNGDHNNGHLPFYTQVDLGLSREVEIPGHQPVTLRFDVVNVFDTPYELRDGTGIGVFAPQFGPRRGFYFGISQKFGPGPG
jgi:outer membrane receptor protein involved in Fe transport